MQPDSPRKPSLKAALNKFPQDRTAAEQALVDAHRARARQRAKWNRESRRELTGRK